MPISLETITLFSFTIIQIFPDICSNLKSSGGSIFIRGGHFVLFVTENSGPRKQCSKSSGEVVHVHTDSAAPLTRFGSFTNFCQSTYFIQIERRFRALDLEQNNEGIHPKVSCQTQFVFLPNGYGRFSLPVLPQPTLINGWLLSLPGYCWLGEMQHTTWECKSGEDSSVSDYATADPRRITDWVQLIYAVYHAELMQTPKDILGPGCSRTS